MTNDELVLQRQTLSKHFPIFPEKYTIFLCLCMDFKNIERDIHVDICLKKYLQFEFDNFEY